MRASLILLGLAALAQVALSASTSDSCVNSNEQSCSTGKETSNAVTKDTTNAYPTGGKTSSGKKAGPIRLGYFSDWTATPGGYTPDKLPMDQLTHINYAFALINNKTYIPYLLPSEVINSTEILGEVVRLAHAKNVKVAISIGGWTGSVEFQAMVRSPLNRAKFIKGAVTFLRKNNLDGIDLDWEHPGKQGAPCNPKADPQDVLHYATLIDELRIALDKVAPKKYYISVAASIDVWLEGTTPSTHIAKFNNLDFISLMSYDINGIWTNKTATNSPINPGTDGATTFSFNTAIDAWTTAGISTDKLVMGVPFYGRGLQVKGKKPAKTLYAPIEPLIPPTPKEIATKAKPAREACATNDTLAQYSGFWTYHEIRTTALSGPSTAARGWTRYFDKATRTPWLMNKSNGIFISYDDVSTMSEKATIIKNKKLAGAMIWAMDGDSENHELMNALTSTLLGKSSLLRTATNGEPKQSLPASSTP